MLKVAILSRGPSFAQTWRKVDPNGAGRADPIISKAYQELIGVNDIPITIAVDWWVFRDWASMNNFSPRIDGDLPQIFTGLHVMEDLAIRRFWHHVEQLAIMRKHGRVTYDHQLAIPIEFPCGPEPDKWSTWSGSAALGFAYCRLQKLRRPTDRNVEIDCYGVDLSGNEDTFGHVNTSRNPDRWAKESATWAAMVEIIQKAGIRVNRIRPD